MADGDWDGKSVMVSVVIPVLLWGECAESADEKHWVQLEVSVVASSPPPPLATFTPFQRHEHRVKAVSRVQAILQNLIDEHDVKVLAELSEARVEISDLTMQRNSYEDECLRLRADLLSFKGAFDQSRALFESAARERDEARAHLRRLDGQLDEARDHIRALGSGAGTTGDKLDDQPLPEDDAIKAAHPARSGRHGEYQEAMRLVGARRSKSGLVELVSWLLIRVNAEKEKP